MGGKSKPPPAPDYSGISQASAAAAAMSAQVAREQLAWAREVYAMDKEVSDRVVGAALERQATLDKMAMEDRQRYIEKYQPMEDQLIKDAELTSDPRRIAAKAETAAGKAGTAVSNQFALARTNAQDRLESYGIDPGQVRGGALDVTMRTAEAAARAGAMNMTREAVTGREEAAGRALRSEALNIGKGYPGQVAGAYGLATAAGQSGAATGLATTASGANTMGTGMQWTGLQNQSLGTWGNALTSGFNAQMQRYNAQQQQSSGWGSMLGAVGGIGLKLATGGFFEKGGAVPEVIDTVQDPSGTYVPAAASPSMGIKTDDVPARLNAGEFVVPKEAVSWFGEKHFQKLIEKAKEEKSGAKAKPEHKPAAGISQPSIRGIG